MKKVVSAILVVVSFLAIGSSLAASNHSAPKKSIIIDGCGYTDEDTGWFIKTGCGK